MKSMNNSAGMKIVSKFQDAFFGFYICFFTNPICTISTLLLCGLFSVLSSGLFLSDFSYESSCESFMMGVCTGGVFIIFLGMFLVSCVYLAVLTMLPKEKAQKLFKELENTITMVISNRIRSERDYEDKAEPTSKGLS